MNDEQRYDGLRLLTQDVSARLNTIEARRRRTELYARLALLSAAILLLAIAYAAFLVGR